MRVAVIADVHGNRLALAAVMQAVLTELGDAISGPLWPAECFEMLAASGAVGLAVNQDGWVAQSPAGTLLTTDALINPGSVGQPAYSDTKPYPHIMQAGMPHARWALPERRGAHWRAHLHVLEHDWDAAAAEGGRNGRQDWSRALATGTLH